MVRGRKLTRLGFRGEGSLAANVPRCRALYMRRYLQGVLTRTGIMLHAASLDCSQALALLT